MITALSNLLTLDKHITFKQHIESVVQKCHGLLGVLARSAPFLSTDLLKMAYVSLIRTQLEYCSANFATSAKSHLLKLDVVQKMASRVICRAPRNAHSAPLLQSLQLDSLESRRNAHIVLLVSQILEGNSHPGLNHMFTLGEHGTAVNEIVPRLQIGKRRFSTYAKLLYNDSL